MDKKDQGRKGMLRRRLGLGGLAMAAGLVALGLIGLPRGAQTPAPAARGAAAAAESYTGMYMAVPILRSKRSLLPASAYARAGMDGVFLRVPWNVIQPAPGVYDWSLMDAAIAPALARGMSLSIGVMTGENTPRWLAGQGVEMEEFVVKTRRCETVHVAHPWDPDYIAAYLGMMGALRDHLAQSGALEALEIIKITGVATHTLELRLPRNSKCSKTADATWLAAGYTPERVVTAWVEMAEGLAVLYPDQLLTQAIIEAEVFPAIAPGGAGMIRKNQVTTGARIIAAGIDRLAPRFAVNYTALRPYGEDFAPRTLAAGQAGAVIGWQTNMYEGRAGSGCQLDRHVATVACSPADYREMLERGIRLGGKFIEIWPDDAGEFAAEITDAGALWP